MELEAIAADLPAAKIEAELRRRLCAQRMRGDFAAVHTAPGSAEEVPDHAGARLVVLGPDHPHPEAAAGSPALERAAALLDQAPGGGRRVYRNMLVFLAADAARIEELRAAVRRWLAWRAAAEDPARLDPAVESERVGAEVDRAGEAVGALVGQTWQWLLAPSTASGWAVSRADGGEELAMRASRRLRADQSLFVEYPAVRLRADLDRVPLWPEGAHHVALAEVWEAYARSLELPRLRSSAVLAAAVISGVAATDWVTDTFAYAESWDAERGRFDGLQAGYRGNLVLRGSGLLVRAEAARAQLEAEPGDA